MKNVAGLRQTIRKAFAKVKNSIRLPASAPRCEPKSFGNEIKKGSSNEDQNRCEMLKEATVSSNFLDESEPLKFVRKTDKVMTSEVVRR
jgi:hypothetical protein